MTPERRAPIPGATAADRHAPKLEPSPDPGEGTPLSEFPWSDDVVGLGFLPDELGLPSGWSWAANRARRD
jgi:hypothetical protein